MQLKYIYRFCLFPLFFLFALGLTTQSEAEEKHADDKVMLVLDVSGSMWGQIDGKSKIEIAREALKTLLNDWPAEKEVGLVAYGHRRKGDCADIETLIPIGPLDKALLAKTVDNLTPRGMTPLSASVRHAAEALKYTENKATVILISDGVETCNLDPCQIGSELESLGVDFTAHVIGFDVTAIEDQKGLKCLAENTGGVFIPAANAEQLNEALEKTVKVELPTPTPTAAPTSTATTAPLPSAKITSPESATKGTEIKIQLEADRSDIGGYVYIYSPARKEKKQPISYAPVTKNDKGGYNDSIIRLPAETGTYILTWEDSKRNILAQTSIESLTAEIRIEAPTEAISASQVSVNIEAPEGLDGYIYLYAAGKEKYITYTNVRESSSGGYEKAVIRMPAQTGKYQLKWESSKREVLAEADISVIDAEIALEAPQEAPIATQITVKLNAPDGLSGYIYLYAEGKDKSITYSGVRASNIQGYEPVKLRLPAKAGNYELKWQTSRNEVLATTELKVVDAQISLNSPSEVVKDESFSVSISAPAGISGYLYLYKAGSDKHITYRGVREGRIEDYEPVQFKAPQEPGEYDIKWQTSSNEILAESMLKVIDGE